MRAITYPSDIEFLERQPKLMSDLVNLIESENGIPLYNNRNNLRFILEIVARQGSKTLKNAVEDRIKQELEGNPGVIVDHLYQYVRAKSNVDLADRIRIVLENQNLTATINQILINRHGVQIEPMLPIKKLLKKALNADNATKEQVRLAMIEALYQGTSNIDAAYKYTIEDIFSVFQTIDSQWSVESDFSYSLYEGYRGMMRSINKWTLFKPRTGRGIKKHIAKIKDWVQYKYISVDEAVTMLVDMYVETGDLIFPLSLVVSSTASRKELIKDAIFDIVNDDKIRDEAFGYRKYLNDFEPVKENGKIKKQGNIELYKNKNIDKDPASYVRARRQYVADRLFKIDYANSLGLLTSHYPEDRLKGIKYLSGVLEIFRNELQRLKAYGNKDKKWEKETFLPLLEDAYNAVTAQIASDIDLGRDSRSEEQFNLKLEAQQELKAMKGYFEKIEVEDESSERSSEENDEESEDDKSSRNSFINNFDNSAEGQTKKIKDYNSHITGGKYFFTGSREKILEVNAIQGPEVGEANDKKLHRYYLEIKYGTGEKENDNYVVKGTVKIELRDIQFQQYFDYQGGMEYFNKNKNVYGHSHAVRLNASVEGMKGKQLLPWILDNAKNLDLDLENIEIRENDKKEELKGTDQLIQKFGYKEEKKENLIDDKDNKENMFDFESELEKGYKEKLAAHDNTTIIGQQVNGGKISIKYKTGEVEKTIEIDTDLKYEEVINNVIYKGATGKQLLLWIYSNRKELKLKKIKEVMSTIEEEINKELANKKPDEKTVKLGDMLNNLKPDQEEQNVEGKIDINYNAGGGFNNPIGGIKFYNGDAKTRKLATLQIPLVRDENGRLITEKIPLIRKDSWKKIKADKRITSEDFNPKNINPIRFKVNVVVTEKNEIMYQVIGKTKDKIDELQNKEELSKDLDELKRVADILLADRYREDKQLQKEMSEFMGANDINQLDRYTQDGYLFYFKNVLIRFGYTFTEVEEILNLSQNASTYVGTKDVEIKVTNDFLNNDIKLANEIVRLKRAGIQKVVLTQDVDVDPDNFYKIMVKFKKQGLQPIVGITDAQLQALKENRNDFIMQIKSFSDSKTVAGFRFLSDVTGEANRNAFKANIGEEGKEKSIIDFMIESGKEVSFKLSYDDNNNLKMETITAVENLASEANKNKIVFVVDGKNLTKDKKIDTGKQEVINELKKLAKTGRVSLYFKTENEGQDLNLAKILVEKIFGKGIDSAKTMISLGTTSTLNAFLQLFEKRSTTKSFTEGYELGYEAVFGNIEIDKVAKAFKKVVTGKMTYEQFKVYKDEEKNKLNNMQKDNISFVFTDEFESYVIKGIEQEAETYDLKEDEKTAMLRQFITGILISYIENNYEGFYALKGDKYIDIKQLDKNVKNQILYRLLFLLIERDGTEIEDKDIEIKFEEGKTLQDKVVDILNNDVSKYISKQTASSDSKVMSLEDLIQMEDKDVSIQEAKEQYKKAKLAEINKEIQLLIEDNLVPIATNKLQGIDMIRVAKSIQKKA